MTSRAANLCGVSPGLYVTTKPRTQSHIHTARLGFSTRTRGLICPSRTQKPGSFALVAGASAYDTLINWLNISCDRICPGRHLALRLLYLTIARILTTFDILPPVDEDGRPRIPEARFGRELLR